MPQLISDDEILKLSKVKKRVKENETGQFQPDPNPEVKAKEIKKTIDNSKYRHLAKEIVKMHEERSAKAFILRAYRSPKKIKNLQKEKYMELVNTINSISESNSRDTLKFKPERTEVDETF